MGDTTSLHMLGTLSCAASNGPPISLHCAMQIPSLGRLSCFAPLSSDKIFLQEKQCYSSFLLSTSKWHKNDIIYSLVPRGFLGVGVVWVLFGWLWGFCVCFFIVIIMIIIFYCVCTVDLLDL